MSAESDALQQRLTNPSAGGVYAATAASGDRVRTAAAAAGLHCLRIDLAHCTDRATLFKALAAGLSCPDGFGHNLDALADTLGDLEWLAPDRGLFIELTGCATPARACGEDFARIIEVFADAATEWRDRGIPFWTMLDVALHGVPAFAKPASKPAKRPYSVLVLIHSPDGHILLIERAKHPGYWQSVTGSIEQGETPEQTARREVEEETGIVAPPSAFDRWHHTSRFEIYPIWRQRYAPGVTHNTEHAFSLCVPRDTPIRLAPDEHRDWRWLPWREALDTVFSWTNRDAIRMLIQRKRFTRAS